MSLVREEEELVVLLCADQGVDQAGRVPVWGLEFRVGGLPCVLHTNVLKRVEHTLAWRT